ncbi:MAG: GxxExxY protein [Bacteroidaceae bacterium]|nr:GxxExxY protein [Bacteroidaceae bacterium]
MRNLDELSYRVIGCAMEVHNVLGAGLLESVYEQALIHELTTNGIQVKNQVDIDVYYKGKIITNGLRLDLLVEDSLIVELKTVEELKPIHHKQLQTYLRVMDKRVGLLINFNTVNLRDGIKRIVNKY